MSDARENKHSMAIDDSTTSLPLICQVNLAREFRGGERQTELLTRELSDEGWPQRLVIRTGNLLGKRLAGLPKLDIREVSSNPVAAALACRGTSLVHAHEARAVYSGWLASLLFKTPYIMTRRVVNPQKKSGIRESAYRRASATVAITEAAAETMRHQQSFVEPHIIPSSAAALEFDEATADDIRGRFEGKTLIGHIGTLDDSSKGQRTLFEVARRASTSHPDWQFIFVGDGRDQRAFEDETRDLNNVHFEGFADNVGDYLTPSLPARKERQTDRRRSGSPRRCRQIPRSERCSNRASHPRTPADRGRRPRR